MTASEPLTHVSLSEKQQKKRQKIDKSLAFILEVLNTGAASRFPIAQQVFGLPARIFEIAQKVRSNQDEFVELAEESCRLVYSITITLKDKQELEQNLKDNLEQLLETLKSILDLGGKCAARGTFKAVVLYGFDANEIKAQRRKLKRSMQLFEFQSLLELREKTNQLVQQHIENGGNFNQTTNANNTTDNKISFGDNANFSESNGNVMGVGNAINHNSNNNNGGGAGPSSTNTSNNNNRISNSVSFGNGANFSNTTANAFGVNSSINYNSNNRTGNVFGSDNTVNDNSDNRSGSHENNDKAQNNRQRNLAASGNNTNNSNNTTTNDIKFGNSANFGGSNGNVFGANNHVNHNSNNVYDSSTNTHNNGSNNHTVSHWGNNNQTHIGNNNANNQGIIGGGSNNVVNSGQNSGHQFFPNSRDFAISGGEFSNVGGNAVKNNNHAMGPGDNPWN